MKIAIVSDIHANPLAFNAVLEDIKSKKCEMLLCLGDYIMAGYNPNEIVKQLKFLTAPKSPLKTELILGNTDLLITHYVKDGFDKVYKVAPCMAYALKSDLELVSDDSKKFLKTLDTRKEIEIDNIKIYMCHGSTKGIDVGITNDMTLDEVEELTSGANADLVVCGHTHIPCGYQLPSGKTVVNVGSVGRPMTLEPEACYAVLETNPDKTYVIEHQFVKYRNDIVAKKIRERGFEECDTLAKMFER